MPWLLPLVGLLLLPPAVLAQADLSGRIVDRASGAGIAGATVQVEGTRRSTVTNDDGAFVLHVDRLPATLVVRRISFVTARPRVLRAEAVEIALDRAELTLEAFDVSGEDPAVRLMRRVIEARQRRKAALTAYGADAYTRYVIRNDTGIVALVESESNVFWRREGGLREIVRARRQTENLPLRGLLPAADNVLDLSAEEVELAGFHFVGLTNAEALGTYRFRITGQRVLDGQRVYDLDVAPRDPLSVAFAGTIAVLDSAAAIIEADLRPGPAFRFPPPIQRYEARLRQTFGAFGDAWLPAGYRANTDVEVGMAGMLRFPAFRIEQISRLSDYRVGEGGPDSLFAKRRTAVADTAARHRTPTRGVPLTLEEQAAYATVDSSATLQRAFKPTGPLARFVRIRVRAGDDTLAGSGGRGGPHFAPEPRLWYNRVEGFHLGAALAAQGARGGLRLEGGYETETKRGAYDARLALGPSARRLELAYGEATVPIAPSYLQSRALNGVGALLGNGDAFDYTHRRRAELGISTDQIARRRRRPLGRVGLLVRAEHHTAPAATADFALKGRAESRPNPAFAPLDLRTVEVQVGFGGGAAGHHRQQRPPRRGGAGPARGRGHGGIHAPGRHRRPARAHAGAAAALSGGARSAGRRAGAGGRCRARALRAGGAGAEPRHAVWQPAHRAQRRGARAAHRPGLRRRLCRAQLPHARVGAPGPHRPRQPRLQLPAHRGRRRHRRRAAHPAAAVDHAARSGRERFGPLRALPHRRQRPPRQARLHPRHRPGPAVLRRGDARCWSMDDRPSSPGAL